jgi:hypothetical protein
MKYLKLFQNENEYLSYKDSSDYITPNVSMIFENRNIRYQKKIKPLAKVGDVAYWDGSSVKTTPLSSWNTSLGTPVGVVMIPENFLPDGKARIISLTSMNNGNRLRWDRDSSFNSGYKDSPVPNVSNVPTTDNAGSTSTGINSYGHLPSDRSDWSGPQSYVDPLAKYCDGASTPMIPSPYLGEEFNPAYVIELDGGNVLCDFNGLSNTQLLVNEGERYAAAHACWNYKDQASSNLQWYLPPMGELGFLMPRFELINQSIQSLIAMGVSSIEQVDDGFSVAYWSSSEQYYPSGEGYMSYSLYPYTGSLSGYDKGEENGYYVRAVASL